MLRNIGAIGNSCGVPIPILIKNHLFIDGNKRTAIAAASIYFPRNNDRLKASNKERERCTLKVAGEHPKLKGIAQRHSMKVV